MTPASIRVTGHEVAPLRSEPGNNISDRYAVAVHEAGHLTIGASLRLPGVEQARLVQDDAVLYGGLCGPSISESLARRVIEEPDSCPVTWPAGRGFCYCIYVLAGPVSEWRIRSEPFSELWIGTAAEPSRSGWRRDLVSAEVIVSTVYSYNSPKFREAWAWALAATAMHVDRHWALIERAAALLDQQGCITAEELRALRLGTEEVA